MAYARQMLFLALLYDQKITSRSEKAKMFLEILGNVELRESTFKVKKLCRKDASTILLLCLRIFFSLPSVLKGDIPLYFYLYPKMTQIVKLDYEDSSTLWTCTFQQSILCT